ncbi:MAG: 4Fe-4S dicluster domain-containing protein [Proteobacteria bacterium]|nr:4Fe-4S dicluster domain-containing protein [Pseudomonadota bacterium]MBU1420753.1 4Fe-4S dicluster domain-containing protein [Pseudomonadota bacterium]MBU1456398.1 4Fe-4S dicluster domain-containing protein [Pseudomonadota bacterium]
MKNYSGHLLCSGKGADPIFSSIPIPVRPGEAFSYRQGSDKDVLLAGGFPSVHPDSSFPLSPTLQLNGDLADYSETAMAAIARAEFTRSNSQAYRTYTLEPDPRVTVLGADANSLQTFTDTYGGVLQIDPLLVRGYHPEMVTAEALEITETQDGFRLRFMVKQAVDLSRCTYCGDCGPVCPEHCLSEQLFLDFSRCTLCKECVAACSHAAIDLHAVENRELLTPAILLLQGAKADLPQNKDKIYSEDTLPRLFKSIYATQVEEAITWNHTFCQYSAKRGIGCTACLNACPHNAVKQDQDGVQIDHLACLECGACLAACPTGALQYKRFDDMHFVEYFRTFALPAGTTVILGSEHDLHRYWWYTPAQRTNNVFFLEHPQPDSLSAMQLLLLFAMGAGRIFTLGTKNSKAGLQVQFVNTILQALFHIQDAVRMIETQQLSACLAEEKSPGPLTSFYHDFSYTNRREKLIDLLNFLRLQSDAEPVRLTDTVTNSFGEIICDEEKCTHCSACVGDCRVESLTADSSNFSLKHYPALCVQCGICITVCPENALTALPGLSLQASFFEKKTVAQAEPVKCQACGKIFGTRKSLEKVISILAAKNMYDSQDDLLKYCDKCRVVNLFERHEK